MSQPRGRYAGSRDSGQRQPRHPKKSPSTRPRQPYVNAPARDPAQTASIFKTRSFQFLVDTVGAENIALGLGSNMARVAELTKGERFTPETAFHMETTLGLPHGFFDQPNPALAPETIARLKSPLDFIQTDDEPEAVSETPEPDFALSGDQQSDPETSLSEEAQMPKKATGGSPKAVRDSRSRMAEPSAPHAPKKSLPSKQRISAATTQQRPLALDDSEELENIRRTNLHVLTGRIGSKARLGVVMAMSGSNMAHRLYGKKRLDSVEANRFTERLCLPAGWLDTPRSEAEIPESVSRLLTPASRGRASVEQNEPHAAATTDGVPAKHADAKARTGRARAGVRIGPESASPVSPGITAEKQPVAVSQQDHDSDAPGVLVGRPAEEGNGDAPAATLASLESLPAAETPQQSPIPLPASVTSLENLQGIAPIAEALIKTLAGKARTGRLDELKALQLLQQAVLL
ncbi:hypothetical protein B0G75_12467 [Paraburkholderia sp. BL18I3N2]|uniref:hypothetical protein n=1 Tax=unclassified Paraburkholderia TaxID=2615204 RepID=UPI000D0826AA|nr:MULTISPECIES: hypothetical protein [unclassified Paraburkholderia]PRX24024.1 hypothetical protein B0G75_12467 [Paraburkholderia sp. BL18I3N2]PRX87514.1 hypothetical protein B0G73_1526 [Paraburkholderia sp. BL25I1N1]